ncbi:MAG: carbohydrate-binding protein [Methylococcales bacterium]
MRKKLISELETKGTEAEPGFLDIEKLAQVEISSESKDQPIEFALLPGNKVGWKAANVGHQVIRFVFDDPQAIKRIVLLFEELELARTQEFVLLWRKDKETDFQEILRQQFNFSPPLTSQQHESYTVELNQVKELELRIIPDMDGNESWAKLTQLRLYET